MRKNQSLDENKKNKHNPKVSRVHFELPPTKPTKGVMIDQF